MMDPVEREILIAELETLRDEVARFQREYGFLLAENVRLNRQLQHQINVKRRMHDRLDALYRRTKAEAKP